MHDANEMECLIFENAIKNIVLGKVTKSGVSDANNKLIITIFQMWDHIDPIRSGIGLTLYDPGGGALKASPLIFCSHAFNFEATLLCVGDFSQKIV